MKLLKLALLAFLVGSLTACATGARRADMVVPSAQTTIFPAVLRNNVTVMVVNGGQGTNRFWHSKVSNDDFSGALKLSLANAGLLSPRGRYGVIAVLKNLDRSGLAHISVQSVVEYRVTDSTTGKTALDTTVDTTYTTGAFDSIWGIKRERLANEGSIKQNIGEFLDRLAAMNAVAQR